MCSVPREGRILCHTHTHTQDMLLCVYFYIWVCIYYIWLCLIYVWQKDEVEEEQRLVLKYGSETE